MTTAPLSVHPHGRGEKRAPRSPRSRNCGSPPRAWGKVPVEPAPTVNGRFTPTGVGKRSAGHRARGNPGVHPHGRGEKVQGKLNRRAHCGSPPRAWGKVDALEAHWGRTRFTPTGVGKRRDARDPACAAKVHPHGRGEKGIVVGLAAENVGSPPRAWGKDDHRARGRAVRGFTPTGVGKRSPRSRSMARTAVHPHGRGEKWTRSRRTGDGPGSPPRAWGKVPVEPVSTVNDRFTPTGVGKRYCS